MVLGDGAAEIDSGESGEDERLKSGDQPDLEEEQGDPERQREHAEDLEAQQHGQAAGRAIALGVGGGLGAVGAGVGIGIIFGKVIESVTRQPEMRDEITSIQWLGFALTEAIVFYAFIFGLIAFFL